MKIYAQIYLIYTSALVRVIRLLTFVFLLFWVLSSIGGHTFPKLSIFILLIFLMKEIFFRFRIAKTMPLTNVLDAQSPDQSMTLHATALILSLPAPKFLVKKIHHYPQLHFMSDKLGIIPSEVPHNDIEWKG